MVNKLRISYGRHIMILKDSYEKLDQYLPHYTKLIHTDTHIGDIQNFNVYKQMDNEYTDYAISDSSDTKDAIAFYRLKDNEVMIMYVKPQYRKQKILSMFLFFLKQNENFSKIVLNDRQSEDTVEAVKKISKRFKIHWIKGDEKVPYDINTIDNFYSVEKPTGWKLVLENDGDFSNHPKFWQPLDSRCWYEPLVED